MCWIQYFLCCKKPWHGTSCYKILQHTTCYNKLWHAMTCYNILCYNMAINLCYIMLLHSETIFKNENIECLEKIIIFCQKRPLYYYWNVQYYWAHKNTFKSMVVELLSCLMSLKSTEIVLNLQGCRPMLFIPLAVKRPDLL